MQGLYDNLFIALVFGAIFFFVLSLFKVARGVSKPNAWVVSLSEKIRGWVPKNIESRLSRNIRMAGGLAGLRPETLFIYAFFVMLASLAVGLLAVLALELSLIPIIFIALVASLSPFLWLRGKVARRHEEIARELPYHLDLLTLSVEAGLDFGAAIRQLVASKRGDIFSGELAIYVAETSVGKSRSEALRTLGERVGYEPLSGVVTALVQADRMGTGLGKTLRAQSRYIREERFELAEKRANEAPIKMIFPLVFFIFPALWLVLGAPLVFKWFF